jgi:UDP-glucose 4-epimerase
MILLTGGAGYIGSHTLLELFKTDREVVLLDNFSNSDKSVIQKLEKIANKKITLIEVDICDFNTLQKSLQNFPITSVIHFAAKKAVGESVQSPILYYENNVGGLINILKICNEKNIQNFVFSSSCTVYGIPNSSPVTEDFPIQVANSPYGNTKQIGEEILQDYQIAHPQFKYFNLRYFNPIGAHESGLIGDNPNGIPNNLLPYLTKVVFGELKELTVFGGDYSTADGTCIRDYIHVVDLARAHVLALETLENSKKDLPKSINLGTGLGYSVLEVISSFEKTTQKKVAYKIGPKREGDVPAIYANAALAKEILNWECLYNLEEMLQSAWNFQCKQK